MERLKLSACLYKVRQLRFMDSNTYTITIDHKYLHVINVADLWAGAQMHLKRFRVTYQSFHKKIKSTNFVYSVKRGK